MDPLKLEDALYETPQKLSDLFTDLDYHDPKRVGYVFVGGKGGLQSPHGIPRKGRPSRDLVEACEPHCSQGVISHFMILAWEETIHHRAVTVLLVKDALYASTLVCELETT